MAEEALQVILEQVLGRRCMPRDADVDPVAQQRLRQPGAQAKPDRLPHEPRGPERSELKEVRAEEVPRRERSETTKVRPGAAGSTANWSARSNPAGSAPARAHRTVGVVPKSSSNNQA